MSEYHVSRIMENDPREQKKLAALLEKEGIRKDQNLDYTLGLYDEDYNLAATGSCCGNTLRCMAVDSSHQGEGLLNQVISHLIQYEYEQGIIDLFLYTKYDKSIFFGDLGFYEIARANGTVVFMENRKNGFSSYLTQLKKETDRHLSANPSLSDEDSRPVGAIVMNANPFTLGHLHLVTSASTACRLVHVFVVSEDSSLIPFSVRYQLVKEGCAHLPNVVLHQTGSYLISNATFPSYFIKDTDTVIESHARLDTAVFEKIAQALGIRVRFAGEEPFSHVTAIYNSVMEHSLPEYGVEFRILPRKEGTEGAISASRVREVLRTGSVEAIRDWVPETTYRYFRSETALPVLETIRAASDVIHY